MYKKRRLSFDELRAEIKASFQKIDYQELLELRNSDRIDMILRAIKQFVQKNQRGMTSSQLRAIYDKIQNESSIKNVGFRSFLAFKIVSQRDDNPKRILLLIEELANAASTNQLEGFKKFVEILVAYFNYADTGKARVEKKLLPEARSAFRQVNYPIAILNMSSSNQLGLTINQLKSFIAKNAKGLAPHQLRRIHNKVLEISDIKELKMLRPLFANAIARQKGDDKAQRLMLLVDDLVKSAKTEHVAEIKKFIETLVAYHKYYLVIQPEKEKLLLDDIYNHFNKITYPKDLLFRNDQPNFQEVENLIKFFIQKNHKNLSSSQIRKIYDMIRGLNTPNEIQLVRPRIGYAIARQSRDSSRKVLLLIDDLASKVNKDNITTFKSFLENLIAYHEFFEATAQLGIEI